jgi:hypothetical protein
MASLVEQDAGVRNGKPEIVAQAAQRGPGMSGHLQLSSSTPPVDSSSSRVIPASMAIRAARLPSSSLISSLISLTAVSALPEPGRD